MQRNPFLLLFKRYSTLNVGLCVTLGLRLMTEWHIQEFFSTASAEQGREERREDNDNNDDVDDRVFLNRVEQGREGCCRDGLCDFHLHTALQGGLPLQKLTIPTTMTMMMTKIMTMTTKRRSMRMKKVQTCWFHQTHLKLDRETTSLVCNSFWRFWLFRPKLEL